MFMIRAAAAASLALFSAGDASAAEPPAGRWQGVVQAGGQGVPVGLQLETRPGAPPCVATFTTQPNQPRCTVKVEADGRLTIEVPLTSSRFSLSVSDGGQVLAGTYASPTAPSQPVRMVRAAGNEAWAPDPAPHRVLYATAPDGARIEVLDFGGQGSPIVLIPGLGAGGHVFDPIAPRLAVNHRVIAVTRRGYGASDTPALTPENYTARKQGDDVLAAMAALGIERAALVAWSIGGSEIGSVASRYPEKVSAATYLDAAYSYSYFAPRNENRFDPVRLVILRNELNEKMQAVTSGPPGPGRVAQSEAIRRELLPQIEAELVAAETWLKANPAPPGAGVSPPSTNPIGIEYDAVSRLVNGGLERFGPLKTPILAIFATDPGGPQPARRSQIDLYKAGNPTARVIEIPGADHAVFASHPEEVLAAMEDFLGTPPRKAAPGGEAVVRRLAAAVLRGQPDYAAMTPAGAQSLRNGLTAQQAALSGLGEIRQVTLIGAAPDGRERYRLTGPGGVMEYSIARAGKDAVSHVSYKVISRNPAPGGEAALRKFIADAAKGAPDYASMSPAMAGTARTQADSMRRSFTALGEVRKVALVRADPNGRDIYRVEGAGGAVEMGIALQGGLVQSVTYRALPPGGAAP